MGVGASGRRRGVVCVGGGGVSQIDRLEHALGKDDWPLLPMGDAGVYFPPATLPLEDVLPRAALPYRYAALPWWTDPWGATCLSLSQMSAVNVIMRRQEAAVWLRTPSDQIPPSWASLLFARRLFLSRLDTLIIDSPSAWATSAGWPLSLSTAAVAATEGVAASMILLIAAFLAHVHGPLTPLPPSRAQAPKATLLDLTNPLAILLHAAPAKIPLWRDALDTLGRFDGPMWPAVVDTLSGVVRARQLLVASYKALDIWHPDPAGARALARQTMAAPPLDVPLLCRPTDGGVEDDVLEGARLWARAGWRRARKGPAPLEEWAVRLGVSFAVLDAAREAGRLPMGDVVRRAEVEGWLFGDSK